MKQNVILPLVAIAFLLSTCSQKEVKFETKFSPNRTYTATMTSTSSSTMNFHGDENLINQIKANGTTLPIAMEGKQGLTAIISTGSMNSDNEFSMKTTYNDISNTHVINGKKQAEIESPINGMALYGRVVPASELKIDSLVGSNVNKQLQAILTQTIEGLLNQMTFPDDSIKVGESFEQKIPMSIPVANLSPIQIIISVTRTLVKIEDNKAYFELTQDVNLDLETEQGDVKAYGSGTGNSVYDFDHSFTTLYDAELSIDLVVQAELLEITANMKMTTLNAIAIENI